MSLINNDTDNILSYASILNSRRKFQQSGTRSGSEFNIFDTPSQKYFKILFYFGDKFFKANEAGNANGLLHPTWEIFRKKDDGDESGITKNININYYDYNSAWSYLKLNDENERAEKLEHFVTLLSNINSESPWYFTSISGLDSAVERKVAVDGKFDVNEIKRLQLKCLPDAADDRIGTLLSLYRDITWSWTMKKEIIPANLRKFDMAVFIFESPIRNIHKSGDIIGKFAKDSVEIEVLNIDGKEEFIFPPIYNSPSYRMLEFHNCEFDYNSIKTGYNEISNQTGVQPTYTIDIMYDDCYDVTYNNIMMRTIGDVILTDIGITNMSNDGTPTYNFKSEPQTDDLKWKDELKSRVNKSDTNFAEQIVGGLKGDVSQVVKRALLGNIYTYSLTKIGSDLNSLAQGNLIKAGQTVKEYIKTSQEKAAIRNKANQKPTGNIFNKTTIANNI